MFNMNSDNYDFLFVQMKTYLQAKSKYSPTVLKKPMAANPKYPQVVLSEIANDNDIGNTSIDRRQVVDVLGYGVAVSTTNIVINGSTVDSLVICRELAHLADDVMFYYRYRRVSKNTFDVVDTNLSRIISNYNGRIHNNYNQII